MSAAGTRDAGIGEEAPRDTVTERLVSLIGGAHSATGDRWRDLGERAFADTVGVLLAGASDPAVTVVAGTVDETDGPVRALATGAPMSARSAALLDGTAAHALDYDDVDDAIIGHPSAVLVPALLAAGQLYDASGEALLGGFRVGIEAGRTLAAALGIRGHYELGWHSTGTIGTVTAAAAVARVAGLGDDAVRRALGVAGSLAAGSRANFGTMTKPLHAGAAASNGLLAVRLAAGGFTADPDQLDGPMGFRALHADPAAAPAAHTPTADGAQPPGLNVKLYPCCYYVHSAAEATIGIAAGLDPADVEGVRVVVQRGGLAPLIHHRPSDGTQAKFSMEYVAAACLTDRALTFASFSDEQVARPDVQALLRRVEVAEADTAPVGPAGPGPFAVVTARLRDGREVSARVDLPAAHATRPVTEAQLRAKFEDCVRGTAGDPDAAARTYATLRRLRDRPSVREVVADVLDCNPTVTTRGRTALAHLRGHGPRFENAKDDA